MNLENISLFEVRNNHEMDNLNLFNVEFGFVFDSFKISFVRLNPENEEINDLTEILPTSVLLASTDFMLGVTTNMTLQEINTPLARVDVFNRAEQLSDYDLLFDEDVQYTFSDEGTMYLLANDFDTNLNIGSLSINNFIAFDLF